MWLGYYLVWLTLFHMIKSMTNRMTRKISKHPWSSTSSIFLYCIPKKIAHANINVGHAWKCVFIKNKPTTRPSRAWILPKLDHDDLSYFAKRCSLITSSLQTNGLFCGQTNPPRWELARRHQTVFMIPFYAFCNFQP